ncbi:MAG: glycoside hydrolase family 88 protein [Rhizomicrobium sp.]
MHMLKFHVWKIEEVKMAKRPFQKVLPAVLSLALAGSVIAESALAQSATTVPASNLPAVKFSPSVVPNTDLVLQVLQRSAAAQTAQLKDMEANPIPIGPGRWPVNASWVTAAFLVGVAKLARVSDDSGAFAYALHLADRFHYALPGQGTPKALLNADDQAIGALYEEIYARGQLPGVLMPLKQRLDFAIPYLTKTPQPQRLVWWWCDAMFMAPPVLARMSVLTGDPRYLRAMDIQWWRTYDRLWDPKEHLYYRDERFIADRSEQGKKIFWSRGNGWVIAGLARVLESMPSDFPTRPRYEQLFREMAKRLVSLQQPDGLWRSSLLDTAAFPEAETSGSAFFTYALAFGVNHGLLDRKTYEPHVLRGWAGLNRYVLPNGIIGSVQSAGDRPVPTKPDNTALYASGGFLLAGLEVMDLKLPISALPLAEPEPDKNVMVASNIGPNRPATTAAEIAENRRRDAERTAMVDLAYDPLTDDHDYRSPVLAPFVGGGEKTAKLVPAAPSQRSPRAIVRFDPERFDDLQWENDRIAHRIYGPALEAREPPSSSGIDVWVKRVRWPFMERQLKTGTYHNDQGEGMDCYNVGGSRGDGGLGIWQGNKLWVSRNFKTYRILKNGPDVASFEVDYAPWPVGVDRKVWETRTFTLPLGTNFTRLVSTINSDKPDPLIVGIGLDKHATIPGRGVLLADKEKGLLAYWEPTDTVHGTMGTAVLVDPASVVDVGGDADNYLIFVKVTPGKPFVYYAGASWDQGLDFHSRGEWEVYVKAQTPNFDPKAPWLARK